MDHTAHAPTYIKTGSTGHGGIYSLHERDQHRTIADLLQWPLPDQITSAKCQVQQIAVDGLQLSLFE